MKRHWIWSSAAALLLIAQSDCTSNNPPAALDTAAGCSNEAGRLDQAIQQPGPLLIRLSAEDYPSSIRQPGTLASSWAAQLSADAGLLRSAMDQVNTVYASLKSCRLEQAAGQRSLPAKTARLSAGRSAYLNDLQTVRVFQSTAAAALARLQKTAQGVEAATPEGRLRAAKALAAAPPPLQPYVAVGAASIYALPSETSAEIATLRPGRRAEGPGETGSSGWTTLVLNDGSVGYVRSDALRDAVSSPSVALSAARASTARDLSDPFAALAVTAERTLPDSLERLSSTIESASDAATAAYGS